MKKHYIGFLIGIFFILIFYKTYGQSTNINIVDSISTEGINNHTIDKALTKSPDWRNVGATFTLSGKKLEKMFTGNLLNTLQGRLPGLTVVTGSGEPGYDDPTLYVRGQSSWNIGGNTLLIYLDGFQVNIDALSSLSPYEIESVTLLKGPAALAMFGLVGGSGVLSVRTKEGLQTLKPQITLNARYGIQSAIELPTSVNAYEYTQLYNKALHNDGLPVKYPKPELYTQSSDPFHPNVNWYNEILRNTSSIQDYSLSFRGGGKKAKYFVLGNYDAFEGLYRKADIIDKDFGTNAKYNRINLKANVTLKLSKSLTVNAHLLGLTEDRKTPMGFTADELFDHLMNIPAAAFPVKNPDGTWGNSSVYDFNPVERLRRFGIYSSHTRVLQTNFTFNEKLDALLNGLSVRGGLSFSNLYRGTYQKHFQVPSYEITKNNDDEPVRDADGDIVYKKIGEESQSIDDGGNHHWNRTTARVGLNYNHSFGRNHLTVVALAHKQTYSHDGQVYQVRTQGLSANVGYDYDKRYIVNVSGGYMGADSYAPGHRYGFFPSVGLGWVASNEIFLDNSSSIDFLKLRTSYGMTGNIDEAHRFLYIRSAGDADGWVAGTDNAGKGGMAEGSFSNPNATWEKKTTFDFGVDLKAWKHFSATIDIFNEDRTGILEIPIADYPGFPGFPLPFLNTGEVNNKGFEAVLSYENKVNDFQYYIGGSMSYARNKIIKKSENPQPQDYLYERGYRIGQMRGLVFEGFYQKSDFDTQGNLKSGLANSSYTNVQPGDLKFKDQDGNGVINKYDMIPLDYSNLPEITAGLNIKLKYKGFDFSAFLQGVAHRTVSLLDDAYNYTHPFVYHNNITAFSLNSWTPATAETATTPRLSTLANPNNDQPSDFWLRNGNFLKLRSVELGYTLPKVGILKKLESFRVYLNGTNLFTWDKIANLEAERLSMGYPLMKVISFGLKVKF